MTIYEQAVDGQLEAYNAHDLDGFLSWYTDDVQGFDLDTGKVLFTNKAEMAPRYVERFRDKLRHCTLVNRMVLHRTIVDHEQLTTSQGPLEAIAIYDVNEQGLINVVRFSMGRVGEIR
jgi:hypothetical protein